MLSGSSEWINDAAEYFIKDVHELAESSGVPKYEAMQALKLAALVDIADQLREMNEYIADFTEKGAEI